MDSARLADSVRGWLALARVALGPFGLFGFAFLLFGLPFAALFTWDLDPLSEWRLAHSDLRSAAQVVAVDPTSASENNAKVYRVTFEYETVDELRVRAVCYTSGATYQVRQQAEAVYLRQAPQIAELADCRRSTFGLESVFVYVFPLVGLGCVLGGIAYRLKTKRIRQR